MIDHLLSIIHPNIKKEWELFYPDNERAIARFLYHSNLIPTFHNPVDRFFRNNNILHLIPKKYDDMTIMDILPVAPYRLMKYVLDNKSFVVEANTREEKYEHVVKLLDEYPHGVTSICTKHMSFKLTGGQRLPKGESHIDRLSAREKSILEFADVTIPLDYDISSPFWGHSKRGERTQEDIKKVKNARAVSYEELDILFEELYPFCDEIKSEETRIIEALHKEDIEDDFKAKVLDHERRKLYYLGFLSDKGCVNMPEIQKKEYCISNISFLDVYISDKVAAEAVLLAAQYSLGYDWYVKAYEEANKGYQGDDFLFDCIKHQDIIMKKDETLSKYNVLYSKYPDGINAYNYAHKTVDKNSGKYTIPAPEDVVGIDEDKLMEYQKNGEISSSRNKWLKSQAEFSRFCREMIKNDDFASWGAYLYGIPFKTLSYDGQEISKNCPVWQFFVNSYCQDDSLDYTDNQYALENAKKICQFKDKTRFFTSIVYDKILLYIQTLQSHYSDNLVVLFGSSGLTDHESFNDYHFKYFKQQLSCQGISFKDINEESFDIPDKVRYVIVEVITENSQMIETCQRLFNLKLECLSRDSDILRQESFSDIVYISLMKEHDSAEMQKIISKTKEKIVKKKEQEEIEQKRKNEQLRIQSKLNAAVSSWNILPCGLPYHHFFYYYPTTCDFEATEEEWNHRRIVWNFKNDPDKNIDIHIHKIVLNHVVASVKNYLISTFGEDSLLFLTLVCLPASTKVKNEARYKEFSERLCQETGMKNGYEHTHVVKDGLSKNDPLNTTGHSIQPNITFDDCFKGEYVLLFDDVVTKGKTMLRYKHVLEGMGATVIGGICLGKTKHSRI